MDDKVLMYSISFVKTMGAGFAVVALSNTAEHTTMCRRRGTSGDEIKRFGFTGIGRYCGVGLTLAQSKKESNAGDGQAIF
jgi:hypothetical protein